MGKRYCSREPWDSILGVNRPNGTSRTWNYQENGELDYPLTITGDMVKEILEDKSKYYPQHFSLYSSNPEEVFEDIEIDQIKDNYHIYPIRVHYIQYFDKNINTGFSCISPKVLEDVKNKKALIVVECTAEGKYLKTPGTEFKVIERWRVKSDLPEYSIIVLTGNYLGPKIAKKNNLKLKVYSVWSAFMSFFSIPDEYFDNDKIVEFKPADKNKYFLSFNRQPREHRVLLGYLLWNNKLLDKGKVSLKLPKQVNHLTENLHPKHFSLNRYKKLHSITPITIDQPLDTNLANSLPTNLYEQTFISIVTETLTCNGSIFFSEKIWKPISIGHPFILIGNPNSLKYLKELGFKTFDKWIDESYDSITNMNDKVAFVVNEVAKLTRFSEKELISMRQDMEEILIHNKLLFYKYFNLYTSKSDFTCPGIHHVVDEYNKLISK